MRVPAEILEKILLKCDGKTLLSARKSCGFVRSTIDYLTEKSKLWEWCCHEEIPSDELVEYLPKYDSYSKEKWLYIYVNWLSWEDYKKIIIFDPVLCPIKFQKISCIAVSNNHIAIGSEDGRVRLFTKHWKPLYENRVVALKLTKLTFLEYNDFDHHNYLDICLVIAYPRGLSIISFYGVESSQFDILDIKSHSIHRNYICIEKVGGRMTIIKLINENGKREVKELWFTRIYSPQSITCYKMWNGMCTFLINDSIKVLNYDKPDLTPMEVMQKKTSIKFYAPLMIDSSNTHILRDNIIISTYKNNFSDKSSNAPDFIEDYIEINIIGRHNKSSKKLFNIWEIFKCNITCIYLYGNTLLLGSGCGDLYFYHVSNWRNLDLRYYNHRQIVGKHPIIEITVKECKKERKFYVCSKFTIHEISGILPNVL
ncbi:uncharacterized protein LOC132705297 [Cylas formicarius]|uniref:uncharacterized protein LOC132705297 n=1 Tax=Cylas formicarius TaxID=197179 RepID=UPI002958BB62|nr:uncharacterized protein LOC132705297 [Cylas formicarius]